MLKVIKPKGAPAGQYKVKTHVVFSVIAPERLRGKPQKLTPEEIATRDRIPIRILTSNERWNVYRIVRTGEMFRVKLVVADVYRVKDAFDEDGEPFLEVTHAPLVAPVTRGGRITP